MSLVFIAIAVSLALHHCHPGDASVLRPSPEGPAEARSPPGIRCLTDPLQRVRKAVLDSLNLQTEPHVFVPGMAQIRDYWRTIFQSTGASNPVEQRAAEKAQPSSSSSSRSGNSTHPQCCTFATQVFIQDLGWDTWIIYPESFTFVQCSPACVPQPNHCADDDPSALAPPSQAPCCHATSHDAVPFLYMDETSSLVIGSVRLIRGCGCRHDDDDADSLQP